MNKSLPWTYRAILCRRWLSSAPPTAPRTLRTAPRAPPFRDGKSCQLEANQHQGQRHPRPENQQLQQGQRPPPHYPAIAKALPRVPVADGARHGDRDMSRLVRHLTAKSQDQNPEDVDLDQAVAMTARLHNIGHPRERKLLRPQNAVGKPVQVFFAPRHTYARNAMRFLGAEGHALTAMFVARFNSQAAKPLWIDVSAYGDGQKLFVRRTAAARAKTAFRVALAEKGWDVGGRRLRRSSDGKSTVGKGVETDAANEVLYGSLGLRVTNAKALMQMGYQPLVQHFLPLVGSLEAQIKQRQSDVDAGRLKAPSPKPQPRRPPSTMERPSRGSGVRRRG